METLDMVRSFYRDAELKNDKWEINLSNNMVFSDADGKTHSEGKGSFVEKFRRVLQVMKKLQIKQLITEGEVVCAVIWYEYLNLKGESFDQTCAEIWKTKDGKLDSLTIYLDLTTLWNFLGRK